MPIDRRSLISAAKRLARAAGAVYLLIVFLGGAARFGVRIGLPIPGYPPPGDLTTVPMSLAAGITAAALFASAGGALYLLLRHLDRRAPRPLAVYLAVAAGMIVINLLFHQAAVLGATGDVPAPSGFVALLLAMHDHGYTLAAVVFCLVLVTLGHLAYRSTRYPRVLSTFLIVSLIVATVAKSLWPDLPTVIQTILAPPPVADLWLVAYLVIRGGIREPANDAASHRWAPRVASAGQETFG